MEILNENFILCRYEPTYLWKSLQFSYTHTNTRLVSLFKFIDTSVQICNTGGLSGWFLTSETYCRCCYVFWAVLSPFVIMKTRLAATELPSPSCPLPLLFRCLSCIFPFCHCKILSTSRLSLSLSYSHVGSVESLMSTSLQIRNVWYLSGIFIVKRWQRCIGSICVWKQFSNFVNVTYPTFLCSLNDVVSDLEII